MKIEQRENYDKTMKKIGKAMRRMLAKKNQEAENKKN